MDGPVHSPQLESTVDRPGTITLVVPKGEGPLLRLSVGTLQGAADEDAGELTGGEGLFMADQAASLQRLQGAQVILAEKDLQGIDIPRLQRIDSLEQRLFGVDVPEGIVR